MKDSFKNIFSFEFWQKFGKALMVVVAVMPAAGLMISIGKSIPMINPNLGVLVTTGGVLEQIGWGVIGNLHILFALAIGGSWAVPREAPVKVAPAKPSPAPAVLSAPPTVAPPCPPIALCTGSAII